MGRGKQEREAFTGNAESIPQEGAQNLAFQLDIGQSLLCVINIILKLGVLQGEPSKKCFQGCPRKGCIFCRMLPFFACMRKLHLLSLHIALGARTPAINREELHFFNSVFTGAHTLFWTRNGYFGADLPLIWCGTFLFDHMTH